MPETLECDFHILNAVVKEINQAELKEGVILNNRRFGTVEIIFILVVLIILVLTFRNEAVILIGKVIRIMQSSRGVLQNEKVMQSFTILWKLPGQT